MNEINLDIIVSRILSIEHNIFYIIAAYTRALLFKRHVQVINIVFSGEQES